MTRILEGTSSSSFVLRYHPAHFSLKPPPRLPRLPRLIVAVADDAQGALQGQTRAGLFIHPNDSNLARADAISVELGWRGSTEHVGVGVARNRKAQKSLGPPPPLRLTVLPCGSFPGGDRRRNHPINPINPRRVRRSAAISTLSPQHCMATRSRSTPVLDSSDAIQRLFKVPAPPTAPYSGFEVSVATASIQWANAHHDALASETPRTAARPN
ncbi:hypothetical protein EDB85DRAFT_2145601 [Lactarius pseudohatsudake]|nr:hypothetical protein EDB85DRAFT_2145601 [Lactarius pseudohatsudake]